MFEKAIEYNPRDPGLNYNLAKAYEAIDDNNQANKNYQIFEEKKRQLEQ